jgi:hypothetical protein
VSVNREPVTAATPGPSAAVGLCARSLAFGSAGMVIQVVIEDVRRVDVLRVVWGMQIEAGTRSFDLSGTNDVEIHRASDSPWFISSVEVRVSP